jgi:hypothetical protein
MDTKALIIAAACFAIGCGDSDSPTAPQTVEFRMEVIAFTPGMADMPLADAEVCILDTTSCETTDADGWVTMTLPANSEVTLTVIKEGYSPTLSPQYTAEDDVDDIRTAVLDEQTVNLLAGVLGTPYPLEGGVIAISALTPPLRQDDNGIAGITFAIDEQTPYYLDENGFPSFDIDATTEPDGAGGYIEMTEGVYEVTLGGTASNCVVVSAWPGSNDETIRIPVEEGFVTQAFITCDEVGAP